MTTSSADCVSSTTKRAIRTSVVYFVSNSSVTAALRSAGSFSSRAAPIDSASEGRRSGDGMNPSPVESTAARSGVVGWIGTMIGTLRTIRRLTAAAEI